MTNDGEFRGPLTGLRVLDLARMIAGPFTASLLADFGADVVKVEQPGIGDPIRTLGPQKNGVPLWTKVNGRNKRNISLNIKDSEDVRLLKGLIAEADILVENFLPGKLAKLGLGYEDLAHLNPHLIMLSVSGFGQTGPLRSTRAFGRSAEAFSGIAYISGDPDGAPLHGGFPLADYLCGLLGVGATLAAVVERENNPARLGQQIDLALYDAPFRILEFVAIAFDQLGTITERMGTANSYSAPTGTWKSKDGKWLSMTASTPDMVGRLFDVIGRAELKDDPSFRTNTARLKHASRLNGLIGEWIEGRTIDEVLRIFDDSGIAAAPVLNIADIFAHPHYLERESIVPLDDPDLGGVWVQGVVPKFSRTPGTIRGLAHGLDADRNEILNDWGPTRCE